MSLKSKTLFGFNLLFALLIGWPGAAVAQHCSPAQKPSDSLENAEKLKGEFCRIGQSTADGRDYVLFQLAADETPRFWTFELQVLPGQLGRLELFYLPAGKIPAVLTGIQPRIIIDTPSTMGAIASTPLVLKSGDYLVAVSGANAGVTYKVSATAQEVLPGPLTRATDIFQTTLVSAAANTEIPWQISRSGSLWALELETFPKSATSITLFDEQSKEIARVTEMDPVGTGRLFDLKLPAGTYKIVVQGEEGTPFLLRSRHLGEAGNDAYAAEPDNDIKQAHLLEPGRMLSGRLVPSSWFGDIDYYAFEVADELAKKQFEVIIRTGAEDEIRGQLLDHKGRVLASTKGLHVARLSGLVLSPSRYYLTVLGALQPDEEYTVELSAAAPQQSGVEREPNDSPELATPVSSEEITAGSLSENDNQDFLKVKVESGLELWDFEVIGDGVRTLSLIDSAGGTLAQANRQPGSSITRLPHVLVPKGLRTLSIGGREGNWLFRARRIGPPQPGDELEPNDDIARAAALYPDVAARGWLDHAGDLDFYSFSLPAESRIRLALTSPAEFPVTAKLEWGQPSSSVAEFSNEEKVGDTQQAFWEATLAPGDYYLSLRLKNASQPTDYPYTLKLESSSALKDAAPSNPAVAARLEFQGDPAAAFIAEGQQLKGTLHLHPRSDSRQILKTSYWAADERWVLSGLPGEIALEPGVDLTIPLVLEIAPDSRDDWPMRIEVGLEDTKGGMSKVASIIQVRIGTVAVNPYPTSPIPRELRGGINLAWSNLGAKADPSFSGLIDGIVDSSSVSLPMGQPVQIALAAQGPRPAVGIIIEQPPVSAPDSRLAEFQLDLSADGTNFYAAVKGKLSPLAGEQAFVFDKPVAARFARLTAKSRYGQSQSGVASISELKIIQDPATPFDKEKGFNLASPSMGGHIVYTVPQSETTVTGESSLWYTKPIFFPPNRKEPAQLVLGFLAGCMASLTELTWQADASTPLMQEFDELEVSASTKGPLGPWTSLGTWKLSPGADGLSRLELKEPLLTRNLLFRPVVSNEKRVVISGQLGVWEEIADGSYRSILGEWGAVHTETKYEKTQSKQTQFFEAGHEKSKATPLGAGTTAHGIAKLGETENWYQLELPPETRGIILKLSGNPSPEVALELQDATGRSVPLAVDAEEPGTYSAELGSGTYFVRINQPPRSVIVTWDTSGSVTAFKKGIQRVVERLVWDLEPDRETINLLPFRGAGSFPILENWSSSPDEIYAALADYPWRDDSSNAEAALIAANKALSSRPGLHAIAIITDAASDGASLNTELWQSFAAGQPRIFSLKILVSSEAERTRAQVNLMQDWANLNGGFFTAFSSQGMADLQFRRMAARLRQPAQYSVSYTVSTTPAEPGELVIIAAREQRSGGSTSAVEFLFDASGSMLQRIGKESKINIAKQLLADLVSSGLSQDSQIAIRVFGQGGRGSCSTDLAFPLSRIDAVKIRGVIAELRSVDGAKTAIASSLRAISNDLARHSGKKLAVLITDGEETCGGDPRAEIEQMKSQGVDIRINIVGFSVESEAVRKIFKDWAELGGGEFYDANDSETLQAALRKAILPQFEIVGHDGKVAGRTTPGSDPIPLAPGKYTLRSADEPEKTRGEIEIFSGKRSEFEVTY